MGGRRGGERGGARRKAGVRAGRMGARASHPRRPKHPICAAEQNRIVTFCTARPVRLRCSGVRVCAAGGGCPPPARAPGTRRGGEGLRPFAARPHRDVDFGGGVVVAQQGGLRGALGDGHLGAGRGDGCGQPPRGEAGLAWVGEFGRDQGGVLTLLDGLVIHLASCSPCRAAVDRAGRCNPAQACHPRSRPATGGRSPAHPR